MNMAGKLIPVNKSKILDKPSAVKTNLALILEIQLASKLSAPLNAIFNASAKVIPVDAIAI
jgi:hypothetical protein